MTVVEELVPHYMYDEHEIGNQQITEKEEAMLEQFTEDTEETMTESTIVFDEEEGEMKLEQVAVEDEEEEELSEEPEEDTEIAELRKVYENYESAGSAWEKAANQARSELMAALKEEKADVQDEIDDLRSYSPDDKEAELKQQRQSLNTEIEELRA